MHHRRAAWAGLITGAALAACSTTGGSGPDASPAAGASQQRPSLVDLPTGVGAVAAAQPCPPEQVVQLSNVVVSGNTASIDVAKDPIVIPRTRSGIRWKLVGSAARDYTFAPAGIVFKPPVAGGPASSVSGTSEFVWCFDPTSRPDSWSYAIQFVANANPAKVWHCDPTIVNSESLAKAAAARVTISCRTPPPP